VRRSAAAYVHGSFGSGKSHFMSVLSLMLSPDASDQSVAWSEKELHALRVKHGWLQEKKILRLHLHMIGASSLEAKLFPEYLTRTRELFPDAVLPRLFADEGLFRDAQSLRGQMDDEAFFSTLNEGRKPDPRWGNRATGALWNADRFERAIESNDPGERQKLFDALVKTLVQGVSRHDPRVRRDRPGAWRGLAPRPLAGIRRRRLLLRRGRALARQRRE
jgi:hypothetical protein